MNKVIMHHSLLQPVTGVWRGKRFCIAVLFALLAVTTVAQTDEASSVREKQKWAVGGVLALLAPEPAYYDKNLECYTPPSPMVWFGPSFLNKGMLGNSLAELPLRSGVFSHYDVGFTVLQISRNLYRGVIGVSAGFQFGGSVYHCSRDYSAEKDGRYVDFVSSDKEDGKNNFSFTSVRIPLLIGAQTNNRLFSLQTGLGLCYTHHPGAQWLATAGVGPFTINWSQNLTPLFRLRDGTKAYSSSVTIGVDVWYWLCRFSHPRSQSVSREQTP